jgi:hypothetical protein
MADLLIPGVDVDLTADRERLEAAASLAVADGAGESGLRLAGAADALRAAAGAPMAPTERARLEAVLGRAYRALGPAAADRARTAGRALSPEEALAEAASARL